MAFKRSSLNKCPACTSKTPEQLAELDLALQPILEKTKATGELPKLQDRALNDVSLTWRMAPAALRFHLKECLLGEEIKDQRLVELKDMIEAVQLAKQVYMEEGNASDSYAYTNLVKTFLELANSVEGQQDPEVTVAFIVENGLTPLTQGALLKTAEELNSLRNSLRESLPKNQHSLIDSTIKSSLRRLGSSLKEVLHKALSDITKFYKVELDAKDIRLSLTSGIEDPVKEAEEIATSDREETGGGEEVTDDEGEELVH